MKTARTFLIISLFLFLYSSAIFRLYNLQIEKGAYYAARAASQHRIAGFLEPKRGNIYFTDKNNNFISAAMTKPYPVIYAVPKEIKNPEEAAKALAPILNGNAGNLAKILGKSNDPYESLLKKASQSQVKKTEELNIKGIYIDEVESRFYPLGNLASQVLGFVSPAADDDFLSGRYGIELYFDDKLSGEEGRLEGDRLVDPIAGEDIYTTIDSNIQIRAEEILSDLVMKYKAESGIVMVQEPKTGKILALGVYPNFDLNSYGEYDIKTFLNPAIQSIYEPGSIFKVITMAAGIDSGKITPETRYYDSGSLTLDGRTIKNWDLKAHGWMTMTEVIEQSINTGAAYAAKMLGNDLFYNYLVKFGFSEKTGIKLPGELSGNLINLEKSFRQINFATASFGQGVAVTPIRLISAISAIANGGVVMKPYIYQNEKPAVVRRTVSEEAARQVTGMMVSAVKKAQIAQVPKFDVAGKTGTAQVPDFKRGGYTDQVINTYSGFAPAYDPRFTILIRIDKPAGAPLAGLTVVPAFRELAEFILNYYNVPPDYLE